MSTAKYIFTETQYAQELERLQAIEKIFDPTSRQRLESTGMTTNWRCLEVGQARGPLHNGWQAQWERTVRWLRLILTRDL